MFNDAGQVDGARVADGDGGVRGEQEHGHGLAEDHAAANHHGLLALDVDVVGFHQTHDAFGRRRAEAGQ